VHEGFGLTVAEALAAKVPTLVSSGQGPEEIIEGEKYGWVFNNGDIDNLVYKLEYITDHYDEAIRKSDLAYTYVNEAYNIAVTAKTYLEQYKIQVGGTQN
jgi:glycosyltransferase involved in cell wall biosynthesis